MHPLRLRAGNAASVPLAGDASSLPTADRVFIRRVDGGSLQKLAGDLWENPAQLPAIIFDELLQTGMIAKIDSDGDCYQLTDAARKLGLLLDQR
jgi:hypothetical protein